MWVQAILKDADIVEERWRVVQRHSAVHDASRFLAVAAPGDKGKERILHRIGGTRLSSGGESGTNWIRQAHPPTKAKGWRI